MCAFNVSSAAAILIMCSVFKCISPIERIDQRHFSKITPDHISLLHTLVTAKMPRPHATQPAVTGDGGAEPNEYLSQPYAVINAQYSGSYWELKRVHLSFVCAFN